MCLADALPPAVAVTLPGFAPLSSMTWMIDFLSDAPRTEDGWWLLEARADHAAGGHSTQDMTIWNTAGECVAKGRQMVTVFA
jgi:acyl-CoA thioesterase